MYEKLGKKKFVWKKIERSADNKMTDKIYDKLADALDKLPNAFPRTASGVEITILKRIFSPEEASLVSQLNSDMEPVDSIAERTAAPVKEVRSRLMKMVKRGLVWFDKKEGKPRFRPAPFIVGIYEAQLENMDPEFAHLVEKYMVEGGAAGIMKPRPALHRVVPAQSAVKTEWVLPYDDVRAVLLASRTFNVRDCICRTQQHQIGSQCNFPLNVCLTFSSMKRSSGTGDISLEEALAILDQAEEIGLVHTVSNIVEGIGYVCNCCGCCCAMLRGITEWGIENSVAYANYYAVIDSEECLGCGICIERCQIHAISEHDEIAVVDRERCIGCGLCVTGCPHDAAKLQRKPEAETVEPPGSFAVWERERLSNR